LTDGVQIGDSSYAYYGASTEFSVTVDALATPEPGSWLLFGGGFLALLYYRARG